MRAAPPNTSSAPDSSLPSTFLTPPPSQHPSQGPNELTPCREPVGGWEGGLRPLVPRSHTGDEEVGEEGEGSALIVRESGGERGGAGSALKARETPRK